MRELIATCGLDDGVGAPRLIIKLRLSLEVIDKCLTVLRAKAVIGEAKQRHSIIYLLNVPTQYTMSMLTFLRNILRVSIFFLRVLRDLFQYINYYLCYLMIKLLSIIIITLSICL